MRIGGSAEREEKATIPILQTTKKLMSLERPAIARIHSIEHGAEMPTSSYQVSQTLLTRKQLEDSS